MICLLNEHNWFLGGHCLFVDYEKILDTAKEHWLSGKWEWITIGDVAGDDWHWFLTTPEEFDRKFAPLREAFYKLSDAEKSAMYRARDSRGRP